MLLFPDLTIYSAVKKYVVINNKENNANILLSIIFSVYWVSFHCLWFNNEVTSDYSVLCSLEDARGQYHLRTLWFGTLKRKRKKWNCRFLKNSDQQKTLINDTTVSINFQIVYTCTKNCENKTSIYCISLLCTLTIMLLQKS